MKLQEKIEKALVKELVRCGESFTLGEATTRTDIYDYSKLVNTVNGNLQYRFTKEYALWNSMITRCYSPKFHEIQPNYIGASVQGEFRDFSSFKNWLIKNGYYQHSNLELDKDILSFNGNPTYSEDTSILIPKDLNTNLISFTKAFDSTMTSTTSAGKYQLQMSINGRLVHFQVYQNQQEFINNYRHASSYKILKYIELHKNNMPTISYNKIINSEFYKFVLSNVELIDINHKKIIDQIIK